MLRVRRILAVAKAYARDVGMAQLDFRAALIATAWALAIVGLTVLWAYASRGCEISTASSSMISATIAAAATFLLHKPSAKR